MESNETTANGAEQTIEPGVETTEALVGAEEVNPGEQASAEATDSVVTEETVATGEEASEK